MLKDAEKKIYVCDRCKIEGIAKNLSFCCFIEYSDFEKNINLHLCKLCYEEYFKKLDEFIDGFFSEVEK